MNVGPLAPWYRLLEYCAFGRALERRRFAFLPRLHAARTILILGEGDGRLLSRLLELLPEVSIDVVESSGEMIAQTRRRNTDTRRVCFLREDARQAQYPRDGYDGVVTCFFLDCFPESEARELVGRITRSLKTEGIWLMTDFSIPVHGWRHWHATIWIGAMYRFFRIATGLQTTILPPIEKLLSAAGMVRLAREEERAGMIVSEVWEKRHSFG